MSPSPPPPALAWALALFLALLVTQRVSELAWSARNVRFLRSLGARQHGRRHFPLIVAVHVLFPLALAAEVLLLDARPWPTWPLWLGLLLLAQGLRLASMRALGHRWSVGVWVVPGSPKVWNGPYRFMRHPSYTAVALELLSAPLLFGAWRTAIVISLLDTAALAVRIRCEERAMEEAGIR